MPQPSVKPSVQPRLFHRVVARLAGFAIAGIVFFWVVQRSSARLDASTKPAGFARGVLHGALMPLALPNLLLGANPTIYAADNTGRLYKLGYTVGVNGCGLVFFGFFFWRLNRLRRRLRRNEPQNQADSQPPATQWEVAN